MAKQAVLIHKEIYTYVCKHICICVYITKIRKRGHELEEHEVEVSWEALEGGKASIRV